MIHLRTLGALDLRRRDGPALLPVLAQPKRVALLCYLALAQPRGFHRRDTLLALFWPEADSEHARGALRQAVHFLRRSLGEDVITARGDDDLAVGEGVLECDAVAFEAALAAFERERALGLYRGDLLPGFHVEGAPDFERWLEAQRARLRGLAVAGAWALAEDREGAGDASHAAEWARAAFTLASDDAALRRLMRTLARLGDPQAALATYETWARRLHAEYELEPSGEARALVEEIRARDRWTGAPDPAPAGADRELVQRSAERADAASPAGRQRTWTSPPLSSRLQAPPVPPRRWLAVGAGAFALVALVMALLVRRPHAAPPPVAGADPASVAVLPLEDLSPGHDQGYFADGLTEELISLLGTAPGLRVPGRTSSFYFRDKRLPVQEIARQLGVHHVLEGSVRKMGREVTVTVHLSDAETGRMLWSRSFHAADGNVVTLQRNVARLVVGSLGLSALANYTPRSATLPEVYDLYLQGLYSQQLEWDKGDLAMQRTLSLFRRALDIDPGFAPARAGLALAYSHAADWEHAREAAELALALDSTLALARVALASSLAFGSYRWIEAERQLDRGIELSPSTAAPYRSRATIRFALGRFDQAMADFDRAEQLDPLVSRGVGRMMLLNRMWRFDEVLERYRQLPPLDSLQAEPLRWILFRAYLKTGHRAQAESLAVANGSMDLATRARGNRADMLRLVRRMEQRGTCEPYVYDEIGRPDRIIDCLEGLVNAHQRFVPMLLREWSLDRTVAADPRFQTLMRRVRLPL